MFRGLAKYWLHPLLDRIQVIGRRHKYEIKLEILVALGGGSTDVVRFGERA